MEEENQFPTPGDYQLSEEEEGEEEEAEEADDDDDDDYDSSKAFDFEAQLDEFRMKWQQELLGSQDAAESSEVAVPCTSSSGNNNNGVQATVSHLSNEDQLEAIKNKAKWFYLEGIKAEQNGNLYNAVTFYRQAVQLVPDIEYHVNYNPGVKSRERQVSETSIGSNASVEDVEEGNLLALLSRLQASENVICSPASEQRATHISSLPVEVVMYIFKWVVSTDLDTRSLEQLSQVCRGFYVCARDEELWKLVCTRMFNGVNCKNCKKYGSWRQMFYQRPHLRYNGCYISKCSYIRQGEKGLDYFYKPWNLVEYCRFVRFFLNGDIVMMSSPEEPAVCITKLNTKFKSASMLCGYYRISGSTITAYLTRAKPNEYSNQYSRRNKRNRPNENDDPEHTFNVEFGLQSAGRRKFAKLIWRHYSLHTFYKSSNRETVTDFDLNEQNYPPLYFSRVKSYSTYAVKPLQ
ncbi:F-box only protein 9 [Octopus vulgaris]|uniref:F-box only protein 9 n=2 Tax=Octopus TaxID=6643 RepID=A0AA36ARU7_OCTVU|nr:F-box only protein 9 [Octopus sinensis]CAI9720569.1 F-box only protein 9 [Octopus vulgaris]